MTRVVVSMLALSDTGPEKSSCGRAGGAARSGNVPPSLNIQTELPATVTMYSWPPRSMAMGGLPEAAPSSKCQSSSPVLAS